MMDMVQTAAVATANAVLPGSGIIVNSTFELGKACSEIAELLTGMQETASSIKTQCANIEKDVAYFRWVLEVLGRVQHISSRHVTPSHLAHAKAHAPSFVALLTSVLRSYVTSHSRNTPLFP
ncbi:hypothetical protein PR003_g24506 [Phytophthora rubi]|uniref:Uncharacterized protein n=1 Tax=Phytophthora rubi TaxID=129364 RepID=A0A6A4CM78_9STRA|nr:hypothetical protein PR003_g24506 [Phytophthora rubi]